MITAETISESLGGRPHGDGFLCLCPAHEDREPSLSVCQKDGKVLVKCFAGCGQDRVIAALKARNLWFSGNGDGAQAEPQTQKPRIVKTYDYLDPAGKLLFQVCPLEPKSFRQRRPDGKGGWIWRMDLTLRVPYHLPEVLQSETVAVCEGEKDVEALRGLGYAATTNPGGAGKWRDEFDPYFKGKKVAVIADNDAPGRAHAQDVARHLYPVAAVVKVLELPGLGEKEDVSDWLKAGGTAEQLQALVTAAPEWKPNPKPAPKQEAPTPAGKPQDKKPILKPITAKDLAAKTFSPPRWAVPDLLPEGLIILAGKPKTGKSWLALNLAVATASGGVALGKIQVEAGEALYLALEDSERRLKERLEKIVPVGELPETLHLLTARDFPPLQKGGLQALDNWLTEHPQARLVVIDTLARVKPARGQNADAYDHDTAIISTLQVLSIKHRLAIICVHHTKKLATDDFVESVSGTFGLTGAADAIAVLIRRDRATADAVLKITGRDVADIEKALKFHPDLGAWEILGEAQDFASTQERQDILLILKEVGPKAPAQLAKILDKESGAIRFLLMKMKEAGQIIRNHKGEYELI